MQLLSRNLLRDADAAKREAASRKRESRRTRASDGDGPIGNYAGGSYDRILPHGPTERRAFRDFYAGDEFDEAAPFGGLDPPSYPMFVDIVRQVQAEDEAQVHSRHLEEDVQHVALDSRPPALLRQYTFKYRMPPRPGVDRLCPRGAQVRPASGLLLPHSL
jgi:hypothetical protein